MNHFTEMFLMVCVVCLILKTNALYIKVSHDEIKVRHHPLGEDEVWPREVAHLFDEKEEGDEEGEEVGEEKKNAGDFNGKRNRRSQRGEEWTGEWPQTWSEAGNATLRHPKPEEDAFVFYYRPEDETYVMSRCTSTVGAPVLTLACPQPRGYPFQRVLDVKRVYYGWSMTEPTCQYIDGDCLIPYEFMHKQILRPNIPTNQNDFYSVGPTFFCNEWDGGGRKDWVLPAKATCTIGARRSTSAVNPLDDQANPYGKRFGYFWKMCGTGYDWFDFIQAEFKCRDIMEPMEGAHDLPEKFFNCADRAKKLAEEKRKKAEDKEAAEIAAAENAAENAAADATEKIASND